MTVNQKRARDIAYRILEDETSADQLDDRDWTLLLLAAGLYATSTPALKVAKRVVRHWQTGTGYFSQGACGPMLQMTAMENWPTEFPDEAAFPF